MNTEDIIDLLLRNQYLLLPALLIVGALCWRIIQSVIRNARGARARASADRNQAGEWDGISRLETMYYKIEMRRVYSRSPSLYFVAIFLVSAAGTVNPIPATTGLHFPEPLVAGDENKDLVLFIHGWNGDTHETWRTFPTLVHTDPLLTKVDVLAISYPNFVVRRNLQVRPLARWVNDALEQRGYYRRYKRIWLVAHSMGGLVAREIVIANRLRGGPNVYQKIIAIGTPHMGADIARLASSIGISRGLLGDILPGSAFLATLRDDWNELRDPPRTFCLTSPQDDVVTMDSATSNCTEYLRYPQWDHTEMVKPFSRTDERYAVPMSRIVLSSTEN